MKRIDEAKLFDYFFKKAGICQLTLFARCISSYSLQIKMPNDNNAFGLDAWHDGNVYRSILSNDGFCADYFVSLPVHRKFLENNHLKNFTLAKFPKFLKVAVINSCIFNGSCTKIIYHGRFEDIIPPAKSLEELAIKAELEA